MKSIKLKDLKDKCRVEWNERIGIHVVMYGEVILWSTLYDSLDGCEVYLDQTEDEICIVGKTPVYFDKTLYDLSTYGMWYSLEEAEEWLNNPVTLY